MSTLSHFAQILSISTSLIGAGGIAALSLFDIPELQSQPADRSLPMIRWLFSRGSHIFPQAAGISFLGFGYLAYAALPKDLRTVSQLLKSGNGTKVNGYILAAVLAISIAPFTGLVMVPNNFSLIKKNEEQGGARSANAAKALQQSGHRPGERSAEDSVNSKGEGGQFGDLSVAQTKTPQSSSKAQDNEAREMLAKFGRQNFVRALLLGGGGIVGLATALA